MKKHFLLLMGVVVAFTSLLVSCDLLGGEIESPICEVTVESDGNGTVSITNNVVNFISVLKGNAIEVVAVPDEGHEFVGWFVGDAKTPVSTKAAYTFTVKESVVLVAKFRFPFVSTGTIDDYEYVDLGLPSGLKWASYNVGATSPEGYGWYFSWGETYNKVPCTWMYYGYGEGESNTMTKYCTNSSNGTVDDKTVLEPEDDAANVNWGGRWRMPTAEEYKELCEECSWVSMNLNGSIGYKVKGPNGNCIYLPAAAYHSAPYSTILRGYVCYWSSSLNVSNCNQAYCLHDFIGTVNVETVLEPFSKDRCLGYTVRAVAE